MNSEKELDEIFTKMIDKGLYDKAEEILEMVKVTYSRYDEFKKKLEMIKNEIVE